MSYVGYVSLFSRFHELIASAQPEFLTSYLQLPFNDSYIGYACYIAGVHNTASRRHCCTLCYTTNKCRSRTL